MNTHNPYSPPTAAVTDAVPPAAVVRKPVSVWLLQVVCGLAALAVLFVFVAGIVDWRATSPGDNRRHVLLASMFFLLLIVAVLVWALIAAQRRSQFGRWLGVFLLGSVIAILILIVSKSTVAGQESFTSVLGGGAVVFTPTALLLYFSAFSKRARAWYTK